MLRLALLAILASSVLHATSFSSASCGFLGTSETVTGYGTSTCSIPVAVDGNYFGVAEGYGLITGSLSSSDTLGVDAGGGLDELGAPPDFGVSGSGEVTYRQTFATAGPLRSGFVSAVISGFGGYWNASVIEDGYPYGAPVNGEQVPFELGARFEVYLTANGGGGFSPGCDTCPAGGESSAGISFFQLTEADGTTPVPFFEVAPAPEPASRGLLLSGLTVCAAFYVRARKLGSGSLRASSPNSNS